MDHCFAIHQPNYLPWLGYFSKMASCHTFVLLDAVQVPRGQSIANRNKIADKNGEFYLTVPLSKSAGREGKFTYLEARTADDSWITKHLKSIEHTYQKTPHFHSFYPKLKELYEERRSFCDHNIRFIEMVNDHFGIKTKLIRLSHILGSFGEKNELIIDIAKAVGANVYLCGKGGAGYTDPEYLSTKGIATRFTNFQHPTYTQHNTKDFISHLSVIDFIFNCGNDIDLLQQV